MKCYIYKIVNNTTNEKYVGQTTNFSRRISEHFSKLERGIHPNPKLQASWNKYGRNNFSVIKNCYNLTKSELDQKELEEIAKEDSLNNGFNLTEGGTEGNTRSKLVFSDFCEIYFGNTKYTGLTTRTGHYYGCDSSTVSVIKNKKGYDRFREKADALSDNEKEKALQRFIDKLDLAHCPPKSIKSKLSDDDIVNFLCIISCYGRGAEAAYIRKNNLSKGLGFRLQKGEYIQAQHYFSELAEPEISEIANKYFISNNLQNYCSQHIKKLEKVNIPSWVAHLKLS